MPEETCELLCLDLPKAEAVRREIAPAGVLAAAAGVARVLADPTRLTIAAALASSDELCVCDLSWIVARSDKLVSHHVRALRDAGLAERRRQGKVVFYRLTPIGARFVASILDVHGSVAR